MTDKHSSPDPSGASHQRTDSETSNAKLGIILFLVYTAFYGGFVLVNAFQADLMDTVLFAGLNLAVVYGFALIIVAIAMSMVYGLWCKVEPVGTPPVTSPTVTSPTVTDTASDAGDRA